MPPALRDRLIAEAQRLAGLGWWTWEAAADRVTWSDELYRIYGLEPGAFGASFAAYLERVHPDDRARVRAEVERAVATGDTFAFKERVVRPDGAVRVLHSAGEVLRDPDGSVRLLGVCHDVTERVEAEDALRRAYDEMEERVAQRTAELARAEVRFRAIVEACPTPLLISRVADGAVLYANARLEALVGVETGGLAGRTTPDFYADPADRSRVLDAVRERGEVRDHELRIRRADGATRWVALTVQPLAFDAEPALATALLDVTERKATERALRERTGELEAVFRALPDLYFRMDADGTIRDYRAGRQFGLYAPPDEFLGRPMPDVLPPDVGALTADALAEVARTGEPVGIEYTLPLGDERRDFEARLLPLDEGAGGGQVVAVVRDVTAERRHTADLDAARREAEAARGRADQYAAGLEASLADLRRAQDRLVQQEKMASLGALTAGIAHEIKNPLTFVTGFASVSRDLLDEVDAEGDPGARAALLGDLRENVAKIEAHGRRADAIVQAMMAHARSGSSRRRRVDLNGLVEESASRALHAATARRPLPGPALVFDLAPDAGAVEAVPEDLDRVVVSLVDNALGAVRQRAEAEGDGYVPAVTVSTRRDAGGVEIRVADNGTGMPEAVRARVFEPFFTTKPPGEGIGLGLSLAHDIVVQGHGGALTVESVEADGSTFILQLP
ncbi:hypothetical protein BSZ37_12855 [Rubrivirga marina]|uniref:histidine kinase n=2 Tax=Rubrivirga marina TaxID=1196024 RepID=A0A271J3H7_9BACT|nr:hypothetical protein BSZ37_12855 [Rubrivirga marina]